MAAPYKGNIVLAYSNNWLLQGATSNDMLIVTTNSNQSMIFGSSNTSNIFMKMTSNGFLGIGKSNPGFALDVAGDINFTGTLRQGNTAYVGSQWSNNSTNVFLLGSNVGIGASNVTEGLDIRGLNAKVGCNLYVMSNVGIGKSNPGFALDVTGDVNFTGTLRQGGTAYVGSQWSNNSTNVFLLSSNVGLGTSNPLAQLHVTSNLRVDGDLTLQSYMQFGGVILTAGASLCNAGQITLTTSNIQGYSNAVYGASGSNGTVLSIMSNTSNDSFRFVAGAASNEVVRITGTGNLGIGKSNPQYPLDIVGNANFSGNISAGNLGMFRNRIINGDFRINQRNAASNVYGNNSNAYNMDRFSAATVGGASYVITQSNVSIAGSPAFRVANAVKVSVTSNSTSAGDYYTAVQQVIEGNNIEDLSWGTSNAVNATVSFNAYSSSTAPLFLSVRNTNNIQPSLAALSNATTDSFSYAGSNYIASASTEYSQNLACAGFGTTTNWSSTGVDVYNGTAAGAYTGSTPATTVSGSAVSGAWLQIQFPYSTQITNYTMNGTGGAGSMPTTWVLAGSTNGTTWTQVDSISQGQNIASMTVNYTVSSPNQYTYYRLIVKTSGVTNVGYATAVRINLFAGQAYVIPFTPPSANTWQNYNFTIPGPSNYSYNWASDNTAGLTLGISTCAGTNYQAPSASTWNGGNYLTTSASLNTFNSSTSSYLMVTGVQFEKGTIQTPFEFRPYQIEMQLCQRYYTQFSANFSNNQAANQATINSAPMLAIVTNPYNIAGVLIGMIPTSTPMRPVGNLILGYSNVYFNINQNAIPPATAIISSSSSMYPMPNGITFTTTVNTGGWVLNYPGVMCLYGLNAYFGASAEL